MPPKASSKASKPNNPLRNRKPIRAPVPPIHRVQAEAKAAKAFVAQAAKTRVKKPTCLNPACSDPNVVDGVCHSCGTIADDTNIVSEITFGESSNGAAVVQGTYMASDQGTTRSLGRAFRIANGPAEKVPNRDGEEFIRNTGTQLGINTTAVEAGIQIFKLASMSNFTQGRRIEEVAAVCLYTACRKEKPCRIMLIDFADKLSINVFKLGHSFKCLHKEITISADGIMPVLPEDLIFRFASKLEFGTKTAKVAEDAVRMVRRMTQDWMLVGRRPSGVCGAALILAARMNNFRRTITEVVFVVKVTTHTIQKRLEEFKLTPSSALTIQEFLDNEFLESAHDPPSFYEASEEFQKNKKKRKRRKTIHTGFGREEEDDSDNKREDSANKHQKTNSPSTEQPVEPLRRDADGFAIPPQPNPAPTQENLIDPRLTQTQGSIDPQLTQPQGSSLASTQSILPLQTPPQTQEVQTANTIESHGSPDEIEEGGDELIEKAIADESGTSFQKLVQQFGEPGDLPEDAEEEEEDASEDETPRILSAEDTATDNTNGDAAPAAEAGTALSRRRKRAAAKPQKPKKNINVPIEWQQDEEVLESTISEIVNDPNTLEHAVAFARAKKRAAANMVMAMSERAQKEVNMDQHIGEDEFADDPEVRNCMLSAEDALMKEKIWMNKHKGWLRQQQMKEWQKKQAELGPPKARRNRKRKPRIGEGQTEPAATPGQAAADTMKRISLSTKVNYDAFDKLFDGIEGLASGMGSASTSRMTSRAGSAYPESETESEMSSTPGPDVFNPTDRKRTYARRRSRGVSTPAPGLGTPLRLLAPSPGPREGSVASVMSGAGSDYYASPQPASRQASVALSEVAESEAEVEEAPKQPDDGWKATVDVEAQYAALEEEDYGEDDYENGDLDATAFDDDAFKGADDEGFGEDD